MGSVLASTVCHYCGPDGAKATTEDHIVPRKFLPKPLSVLPQWFRDRFTVPACTYCNGAKEWYRSSCNCAECVWVWAVALACFVPARWEKKARTVRVVDPAALSRARRMAAQWSTSGISR